jgi:hypothetical protein
VQAWDITAINLQALLYDAPFLPWVDSVTTFKKAHPVLNNRVRHAETIIYLKMASKLLFLERKHKNKE